MSIDAKWVDHVIAEWNLDPVPEFCQQWACNRPVETWCPLCRAYLCAIHDELYPRRMHDCLKGKADE